MKILRAILSALILFVIFMIVSIVWTGGFEVHIVGKQISCYGLANPILFLSVLLLFRFFLRIGGKNSLTFIGALFFAAVFAEAVLRILNSPVTLPTLKNITEHSDVLGYRLVPLLRDRKIQTNSHGLRDRERSWAKPEGIRRLLGIGDSFTFGYQVDMADCYLKQLERRLNGVKRKEWDVINAGMSGYDMWQYLAYFQHYGYRYEPDLVTIGLFFDDFYGDPSFDEKKLPPQKYRSFSFLRLVNFGRNCFDLLKYQYRYLLNSAWLRSIEKRREYILNSKYYHLLKGEVDPELYQKFKFRLMKLVQIAKEHGARVLVVLIPDVVQLNNPALQGINQTLEDISRQCEVDFLDITPSFERASDIRRLYLLPHDAHTSPEGHRIIAEEIEKKMRAMMIRYS